LWLRHRLVLEIGQPVCEKTRTVRQSERKPPSMTITARKLRAHQLKDALIYWVYIPFAVVGSGMALDALLRLEKLPAHPATIPAALLLILLGLVLVQKATKDLAHIGGGTPNPVAPPRRLVTSSSYRLCRHPMFLGYDLTALGVVLLLRSPLMLLVSYPVFIALEVRFVSWEEEMLERRFGDAFREYKKTVPFLIPFFRRGNRPCSP
jgi:protein-S-isoprenylcysteine O-methyltransferase Ste14